MTMQQTAFEFSGFLWFCKLPPSTNVGQHAH